MILSCIILNQAISYILNISMIYYLISLLYNIKKIKTCELNYITYIICQKISHFISYDVVFLVLYIVILYKHMHYIQICVLTVYIYIIKNNE